MLSATDWAPLNQHGSGLIFLPDTLSPRGNGLNSHADVCRCKWPSCGGGRAVRRAMACDAKCSSVRTSR
eukprot:1062725-Prymnesium_polylepis.2